MKKLIYMIITVALNIAALIIFSEHIKVSEMSSLPVIFMLVLGFFAWQFRLSRDGEIPLNAGNSTDLNDEESSRLAAVLESVTIGAIPFLIPFAFFFSDRVKAIVPSIILCSIVIVGMLLFRILYGKRIKARLDAQEKERQEQEKRERGEL